MIIETLNTVQMIVFSIIYVMFAHFVADFLCQTDSMGNNKGKSLNWLTIHVITYTSVLYLLCLIPFHSFGVTLSKWVLLNGAIHWCVDFVTSKITGYFYIKQKFRWFFHTIGFDQFLHAASLYGTVLLFT